MRNIIIIIIGISSLWAFTIANLGNEEYSDARLENYKRHLQMQDEYNKKAEHCNYVCEVFTPDSIILQSYRVRDYEILNPTFAKLIVPAMTGWDTILVSGLFDIREVRKNI